MVQNDDKLSHYPVLRKRPERQKTTLLTLLVRGHSALCDAMEHVLPAMLVRYDGRLCVPH